MSEDGGADADGGATAASWLVLYQPGHDPVTVNLVADQELTVGRDVGNEAVAGHLATLADPTVSRLHAVIAAKAAGWCVQATNARNGLFVNGIRLSAGAVHLLASRDELRLGERTTIYFHTTRTAVGDRSETETARDVPDLTPGERRVLISLCAPVLDGDAFTPPATVAQMAAELYVSSSAVKQQLTRLYQKFDVDEQGNRRVRLANEALTCGAVRRTDLQAFRAES